MNTKEAISFLMNLSDAADKMKKEIRGIKKSCRILNEEEYHALKDLLLGTIDDLEIADADLHEYQRCGFVSKVFAVTQK